MSTARRILELSPEKREALNALLRRKGIQNSAIPRRKLARTIPLSPGQERLWFADRWQPGLAVYNLCATIQLGAAPNAETVRCTLREILRRHEALRTTFRMNGTGPVQDVQLEIEPDFRAVHAAAAPGAEWCAEISRLATMESRRGFDLATGPLFRSVLFLGERDSLLLMAMHHIVADGWSLELLFREFTAIFNAYNRGEKSPLPEPAIQYSDFALWQRESLSGGTFEGQGAWWEKQLAGVPALQLPSTRPRPAHQSFAGSRLDFAISPETTARLRAFNHGEGVTMNMTLLAAFCTLLHRYSGQEDIVIGCPVAGRNRPELEHLIGFFVNALVLRADLSGRPSFRECVARIRKVLLDALAHQDVPFEQLVQRLQPSRDLSRNPLFQVSFQLFTGVESAMAESTGESSGPIPIDRGGAMFDLAFNLWESSGGIEGRIEYSTDLFDREFVSRMAGHFKTLLGSILAAPGRRIGDLPILPSWERGLLLGFATSTDCCPIDPRCVHERVEAQAADDPNRAAVVHGGKRISYTQLNARANRLAHGLRAAGVGAGTPVAICLDRSADFIVAILGVLKAGGAYVPIDPKYPEERIAHIQEDARAPILIQGEPETWPCAADESNPKSVATPRDLAYVIYTSGSTGLPKGVEIEHGSLMNLVDWHRARYRVSPDDRASQVASISFDAAVWEIWPYLASGASVHIAGDDTRDNPARMLAWLKENEITISFLPTPLAEAVLRLPLPRTLALRSLLTGGDRLRFRPEEDLPFELVNHYGPTENTVVSTSARVVPRAEDPLEPPIGKPIAHTRLYICDENMAPVPIGIPGEIYLGGAGIARGYHGRDDLTSERFVPDPFTESGADGARLYRTGDLGRFRHDGNVEFLGRCDRQLKIRGFRIEPGEIESALLALRGVTQAAVVARDMPGGTTLVAYVAGNFDRESLKHHLRLHLPAHMIPPVLIQMSAIPFTPNGKIDRESLPLPPAAEEQAPVAPLSVVEETLAKIWRNLLHVDKVGIHQDFFSDYGGHSLLAVALVSRIAEAFGIEISPRVIFEAPTIAQLAQRLNQITPTVQSPIERGAERERAPCSFAQRRLWFLDRLTPGGNAYNIPAALRMDTAIDPFVLERAVNQLAGRHESLRTTFGSPDGEPMQFIAAEPQFSVAVTCVPGDNMAEREREAVRLAALEAERPFDLERGPLLRVSLLQLGDRDHVLLVTMHHIVSDGWSLEIFFRELAILYAAETEGTGAELPELPIQYADYAAWQHEWLSGERLERQTHYWKQQLAALPPLELPADRQRPAIASYRGGREELRVDAGLTAALKQIAQSEKATLFMTLLAAFNVLLYRYSGQDDFAIGTLTAGRARAETEGLIGFFVNTLALRANLRGNPTFRELLARVKETALEAFAHAELPFEKLVEQLHPQRDLSRNPLVQVTFQLFNRQSECARVPTSELRQLPVGRMVATFDLAFDIWESGDELRGLLEYSTDLFEAATVNRMLAAFGTILRRIADDADQRVDALPLLTSEQTRKQIVEWNDTARNYPENLCIHELFAIQAARSPHAMAVSCEREQLTYQQLNERAERIAETLRAHGAGPEKVIGIRLPRSPEWIAAILGVMKSGAAFLPIDPEHPSSLVETMLRGADAILTIEAGEQIERCVSRQPASGAVSPRNLAYVIYTSGSTGRRKAVAVEHRALVNHAFGIAERFGITSADRVLQFASPGFDVALEEVFPSLLAGAAVILPPVNSLIAPRDLLASMRDHEVTVANLPSPYWHEWASGEECGSVPESLRLLVIGSDRTDARLVARWLRLNGTRPRLLHAYGVTECTITSLTCEVSSETAELPVGRPLPNVRAYIFDRNLQPVPAGIVGDLYIGGEGLARGYFGGASEAFISSPFESGQLYRTGDRARYLEDGNIVFSGRQDEQIKIRGFRIEPAEIEAALKSDSAVHEAAVVLIGDSKLAAYVTGTRAFSPASALARLRSLLPAYMLPHRIVQLDKMPRTASGKTDLVRLRKLAAEPALAGPTAPAFAGDAEEKVAAIWKETLGIGSASPDDNFFDLGGHSLALLRVHSRIEAVFGKPVSVIDLFRYPTVRTLAQFLGSETQTQS